MPNQDNSDFSELTQKLLGDTGIGEDGYESIEIMLGPVDDRPDPGEHTDEVFAASDEGVVYVSDGNGWRDLGETHESIVAALMIQAESDA